MTPYATAMLLTFLIVGMPITLLWGLIRPRAFAIRTPSNPHGLITRKQFVVGWFVTGVILTAFTIATYQPHITNEEAEAIVWKEFDKLNTDPKSGIRATKNADGSIVVEPRE